MPLTKGHNPPPLTVHPSADLLYVAYLVGPRFPAGVVHPSTNPAFSHPLSFSQNALWLGSTKDTVAYKRHCDTEGDGGLWGPAALPGDPAPLTCCRALSQHLVLTLPWNSLLFSGLACSLHVSWYHSGDRTSEKGHIHVYGQRIIRCK